MSIEFTNIQTREKSIRWHIKSISIKLKKLRCCNKVMIRSIRNQNNNIEQFVNNEEKKYYCLMFSSIHSLNQQNQYHCNHHRNNSACRFMIYFTISTIVSCDVSDILRFIWQEIDFQTFQLFKSNHDVKQISKHRSDVLMK